MRKQLTVTRENLRGVYGDKIHRFDTNVRFTYTRVTPYTEFEPVINLRKSSLVSTIEESSLKSYEVTNSPFTGSDYKILVLPEHIVQEIEVPGSLEVIIPILNEVMPGRWWCDDPQGLNNISTIYLHYPELTINNTAGQSHKITDLVIRLVIDNVNAVVTNDIRGMRFSYTKQELRASYSHSHLPKTNLDNFNKFCLGDGSPMTKFVQKLKTECTTEYLFKLFLVQLEHYLQWESIEGRPHILMATIASPDTSSDVVDSVTTVTDIRRVILPAIVNKLTPEALWLTDIGYQVNPALKEDFWLQLEQDLIAENIVKGFNFNVDSNTFVKTNGNEDLPNFGYYSYISEALNITPRIIETEEVVEQTNIIKRIAPNVFRIIITELNTLLLTNQKLNKNEENRI